MPPPGGLLQLWEGGLPPSPPGCCAAIVTLWSDTVDRVTYKYCIFYIRTSADHVPLFTLFTKKSGIAILASHVRKHPVISDGFHPRGALLILPWVRAERKDPEPPLSIARSHILGDGRPGGVVLVLRGLPLSSDSCHMKNKLSSVLWSWNEKAFFVLCLVLALLLRHPPILSRPLHCCVLSQASYRKEICRETNLC